ncbi:hypothetical protein CCACVL1_25317 [Corchorus capsularis]|uniref:CCHC-type domain-containing protein n=1 Tax=Corchorus capsularis TaxID=210143 RepID=A0A1R3GLB3_COCAP|nr:hypothetical protein CCACVL1_25317 [Corchorus capsularis]
MNHNYRRREPSWTESSESDSDDSVNQVERQAIINAYRPRAWRGPILQAYESEITDSRILWGHCILAYMFDIRVFSVNYLQTLVRREWHSTGAIQVVGRQGKLYTIFVENEADRDRIVQRGPYAFQGAFFAVDWWRTNSVLRQILPDRVPVWLHLLDLPLEYQVPSIAQRMVSLAGEVIELDWMNVLPRNIRYMRVRIWIDPHKPLVSGTMLQMDDGRLTKITFSYERVCKICLNCGIIGHTTPHCPYDNMDIERMLNELMSKIERRRGTPIFYDTQEVRFTDNIMAYHRRVNRHTTRMTFSRMNDDDQVVPDQELRNHFIPVPMEQPDDDDFHISDVQIPQDSEDSDRPQQFHNHAFSPPPFEVHSAPTRSVMLVEEYCEWRDLVTGRNLLPMDFGTPNPDIAESSQMGALRAAAFTNQVPSSVINTPASDREVIPPLDVSFNVSTNNSLISEVAPDLNAPAALIPTDRTGTLQDIITVHARPVPPTLDEWLLCREKLDENNPIHLQLSAADDIHASSPLSPLLLTTGVNTPLQPTTVVSPQPEPLPHLNQPLNPPLSPTTELLPTSSQPLI